MFTREEYPSRLREIGLTERQIEMLRAVIHEMQIRNGQFLNDYWFGKIDGLNAVDRFLRGDMDAHDEF